MHFNWFRETDNVAGDGANAARWQPGDRTRFVRSGSVPDRLTGWNSRTDWQWPNFTWTVNLFATVIRTVNPADTRFQEDERVRFEIYHPSVDADKTVHGFYHLISLCRLILSIKNWKLHKNIKMNIQTLGTRRRPNSCIWISSNAQQDAQRWVEALAANVLRFGGRWWFGLRRSTVWQTGWQRNADRQKEIKNEIPEQRETGHSICLKFSPKLSGPPPFTCWLGKVRRSRTVRRHWLTISSDEHTFCLLFHTFGLLLRSFDSLFREKFKNNQKSLLIKKETGIYKII